MKHAMQKQQDPLNLQGLPQVPPLRDGWAAIESALREDRRRRTTGLYAGGALAAAAAVVLALVLVVQRPVPTHPGDAPGPAPQLAEQSSSAGNGTVSGADTPLPAATLDSLMTLSQRMETRLRRMRDSLGDLPASDLVYQVELEDLVVQVDEELSARPDSLSLWNQRVTLLVDLERLYQNSLRREYRQMASL